MVPHTLYSQNADISWKSEANNHNRPFLSIIEMKKHLVIPNSFWIKIFLKAEQMVPLFLTYTTRQHTYGVDSILGNLQICYWKVEAYDLGSLQIPDHSGSSAFTSAPRQTRHHDKVRLCFDTNTRSAFILVFLKDDC